MTTDAVGSFSYTFTPGANEAGTYSLWAIHPDVKDRSVQSTFAIAGLGINPSTANVRMARGKTVDIPVTISNYGGGQLTGLTFNVQSSSGITANVINSGDNVLTAGENAKMTFRIVSASNAPDTGFATLTATTNEGLTVKLNAGITMVSLVPVISTTPSYIDTGMVRGDQKIQSFTIKNVGAEVLRNARIEGPSTSWMTLTVNKAIGDINPGASLPVGIMLNPPDTLAQGVYDDTLVIYSDNHIPYTYHIQVTITSNAVGNVLFDVLNELMEDVSGATITFQNQTITELIYTVKTGADGTVIMYDIPEGRYSYIISPPPGMSSYSGSFIISPGMTTTVPIALEMNMVTIEWSVTPVTIEDRYEITINQTFETNVPTPVLITEPPSITLPDMQPGQVFNGEFKVTNYGLIAVDDVKLEFPTSFGEYDIEILTSVIPKRIGAMQSITVPYKITRRIQTASYQQSGSSQYVCNSIDALSPLAGEGCAKEDNVSRITHNAALFEEVRGYGGSSCLTSFNVVTKGTAVICPNTPQQRTVDKYTTYTVGVPIDCPGGGGGSGGGGSYVPPPSGGTYYSGSGTPTQTGVGGSAATNAAPINTGNPCECKDGCEHVCPNPDEYCMGGKCTKVTIDYVDAKANGQKRIFVSVDDWVSFSGDALGDNCEFKYKWDLGNGVTSTSQSTIYKYPQAGAYTAKFSVSCKKCGPAPKSDQVMVIVGCSDAYPDPTMCCVPPGKLVPNNPIEDLAQCPSRIPKHDPSWKVNYDGCTKVPDNPSGGFWRTSFTNDQHTGPCDVHDDCYQTCYQEDLKAAQLACDDRFLNVATNTCLNAALFDPLQVTACLVWAQAYYEGLQAFGFKYIKENQNEVCNCCK